MLTRWSDFDDAFRTFDLLQREMDGVFGALAASGRGWPVIETSENAGGFVLKAELPGLAEGDVELVIEKDSLVLRGERKLDAPAGYAAHVRERAPGKFARKIPLPSRIDPEGATAKLENGVLTVTLPKAKESLPRQIKVNAG